MTKEIKIHREYVIIGIANENPDEVVGAFKVYNESDIIPFIDGHLDELSKILINVKVNKRTLVDKDTGEVKYRLVPAELNLPPKELWPIIDKAKKETMQ